MTEKTFAVSLLVTGRAVAHVKAATEAEARVKADAFDFDDGDDGALLEWEYDAVEDVEEVDG